MKAIVLGVVCFGLGACGLFGSKQSTTVASGAETSEAVIIDSTAVTRVPAGAEMWVTLSDELSSDRSKIGDTVTAEVAQDVLNSDERILIPKGSTVIGQVTDLREAKDDQPAVVGVKFDSIRISGVSQPLQATVTESNVEGDNVKARDVGIGAAAGAVIGTIIKPGWGSLAGAAAGAAGGGLISLGMNKNDARLPAGTAMLIKLDDQVNSVAQIEREKGSKEKAD